MLLVVLLLLFLLCIGLFLSAPLLVDAALVDCSVDLNLKLSNQNHTRISKLIYDLKNWMQPENCLTSKPSLNIFDFNLDLDDTVPPKQNPWANVLRKLDLIVVLLINNNAINVFVLLSSSYSSKLKFCFVKYCYPIHMGGICLFHLNLYTVRTPNVIRKLMLSVSSTFTLIPANMFMNSYKTMAHSLSLALSLGVCVCVRLCVSALNS